MNGEQLDADADDCVDEYCEHFHECFSLRNATEAKFADIVIVNHALFFLDLANGRRPVTSLRFRRVIEAHQCERLGHRGADGDASPRNLAIGRMLRKRIAPYTEPASLRRRFRRGLRGVRIRRWRARAGRSLSTPC